MPVAAEAIRPVTPNLSAEMGHLMLQTTLEPTNATENLLKHVGPGEDLLLPTNHLEEHEGLVVPSLEIVTPRGNEARFVDIHTSDDRLAKLYREATGNRPNAVNQVQRMAFEGLVRILDTSGAEGLHHLHGTNFPRTVFHDTRRVGGPTPNIYLTTLGETRGTTQGKVPVVAMLTATTGAKGQLKLLKAIGANTNRQRFKH